MARRPLTGSGGQTDQPTQPAAAVAAHLSPPPPLQVLSCWTLSCSINQLWDLLLGSSAASTAAAAAV